MQIAEDHRDIDHSTTDFKLIEVTFLSKLTNLPIDEKETLKSTEHDKYWQARFG
jgi:hypothetical protein